MATLAGRIQGTGWWCMLTELRVANFKGFAGEHHVPLAPVTLLFGANSSGKTALLHAVALLAENLGAHAFRRPSSSFELSVPGIDLGGYRNLIHRHDLSPGAHIGLGVTVDTIGYRHSRDDALDALGASGASHDFRFALGDDRRIFPEASSLILEGPVDIPLDFQPGDNRRRMQLVGVTPERAQAAGEGIANLIIRLTGATPEPEQESLELDDDDLIELSMVEQLTLGQLERVSPTALARMILAGTGLRPAPGAIGHFGSFGAGRLDGTGNVPREIAALIERIDRKSVV